MTLFEKFLLLVVLFVFLIITYSLLKDWDKKWKEDPLQNVP